MSTTVPARPNHESADSPPWPNASAPDRTEEPPGAQLGGRTPRTASSRPSSRGWFRAMVLRLHFYAGLLVGPFLLVAAASGALYAAAPQLEKVIYHHELTTESRGPDLSLDVQVARAAKYVNDHDGTTDATRHVVAVRPSEGEGWTTRVQFAEPRAQDPKNDSRAIFVDPVNGEIRGDLTVYGSSAASLPFRTWIDKFHRHLLLGEPGRIYSELAASWMWIIALGGLVLWWPRFAARRRAGATRRRALKETALPQRGQRKRNRIVSWHAATGVWLLLGMLFLSATGITWSQYAGSHVSDLRAALSWSTPKLNKSLTGAQQASDPHAGHHGSGAPDSSSATALPVDLGYDAVLASARHAGIDASRVLITPSAKQGTAWTVQESDAHFPTSVDSAAVDPATDRVTHYVSFHDDYPLAAKLARWGVDIHMGLWMGLANQIVLFLIGIGLCAMVVWGYLMWFKRRPRPGRLKTPKPGLPRAPWWGWAAVGVPAVALGWFLPLFGIPLACFVLVDVVRWLVLRRRAVPRMGA